MTLALRPLEREALELLAAGVTVKEAAVLCGVGTMAISGRLDRARRRNGVTTYQLLAEFGMMGMLSPGSVT